jgi:hypothetical protein
MKNITEPLKAKVAKALADINQIGLDMLEAGRKTHAEDPEKGLTALKKVRKEFKGLEAGEKAKEVLQEIEGGKGE